MRHIRVLAAVLCTAALLSATGAFARGGSGGGGGHGFSSSGSHSSFSSGSSKGFSGSGLSGTSSRSAISAGNSGMTTSKGFSGLGSSGLGSSARVSSPSAPVRSKSTFDSAGQRAAAVDRSTTSFRASHPELAPKIPPTPKPSWIGERGTGTRYAPYTPPSRDTYGRYVVVDHDSGSNAWMWLYLLSMNNGARERDEWVYSHRDEMSQRDMDQLRAKDADLENRLARMEASGVAKDPNARLPVPPAADEDDDEDEGGHFWLWIFALVFIGSGIYIVAVHPFGQLGKYR